MLKENATQCVLRWTKEKEKKNKEFEEMQKKLDALAVVQLAPPLSSSVAAIFTTSFAVGDIIVSTAQPTITPIILQQAAAGQQPPKNVTGQVSPTAAHFNYGAMAAALYGLPASNVASTADSVASNFNPAALAAALHKIAEQSRAALHASQHPVARTLLSVYPNGVPTGTVGISYVQSALTRGSLRIPGQFYDADAPIGTTYNSNVFPRNLRQSNVDHYQVFSFAQKEIPFVTPLSTNSDMAIDINNPHHPLHHAFNQSGAQASREISARR